MFPIFRCTDNTGVIVARIQDSGDIFPDGSRHAIVKFVHCQFCQPVIDRRVKLITPVPPLNRSLSNIALTLRLFIRHRMSDAIATT